MGKIIYSQRILGYDFMKIVLNAVTKLAQTKGINLNEIQNKLNTSNNESDFNKIMMHYFSDDIKLIK